MKSILPIFKLIRLKIVVLTIRRLVPALALAFAFLAALPFSVAHPATSFDSTPAASCAGPEYQSFDFWIGDWKAFDVAHPR
jgi:hypothetical protein